MVAVERFPRERRWAGQQYENLQLVLRWERERAGLSQAQLADRLGVRQEWISRYECGERRIDVVELCRIADALGVTVGHVLSRARLVREAADA